MFSRETQLKIRFGPAGMHVFNRNTGLNILFDEIIPPISGWSLAPRQVSVALTNACDLSCHHCYAPKNPAALVFDRLVGWLDELDANGCIGIGFGGGEPTLYPSLAKICLHAAQKTNLTVTMTTHAHRLNNRLLDELAGNLHFVRVSMDGIGATYESIRRRSFDALLERIRALSKITPFGINYVVNSKTIGDLDGAIQLAAELGASEFLLLPEEPVGIGKGIDYETLTALQGWVNTNRGRVPLSISEGNADGFPTCDPLYLENGITAFAHIDASGVLKKTSYDLDGVPISDHNILLAVKKLKMKDDKRVS